MQRILRCGADVLGRVIFIGFGIQIVLGILWMCSAFANLHGFGEGIVCVGQILLAYGAACLFLRALGVTKRWRNLFGVLAILTFPMVMQCHMQVGVWSVFCSALLLLAGGIIRAGGGKKICLMFASAVITGVAVACLCIFGMEGETLGSCVASRFAWPTLYGTFDSWPEECKETITFDKMADSSYEAVGIRDVMQPHLEETVGRAEGERLLMKISAVAWEKHAPEILKQIVWDAAGYVLPPVVVPLQLQGRAYDSYTGGNYARLLQPNPRLGKRYLDYGCWWFKTGLAIAVILLPFARKDMNLSSLGAALLSGLVMTLLFTMRGAGRMDYRATAFLLCAWIALMLAAAEKSVRLSGGAADEENR